MHYIYDTPGQLLGDHQALFAAHEDRAQMILSRCLHHPDQH